MRVLASACCFAALVLSGPLASGYCRTTTSHAPVGYDPAVNGCWTAGSPISWHAKRVPFAVSSAASQQISLSEATRVADLAFGAWNGAPCGGQALGIQAYDQGPVSVPRGQALAPPVSCSDGCTCTTQARDVIVFDDDSWPFNDPVNTLALTTVTFGKDDGQIVQADIQVNTAQHQITTEEPPPSGEDVYDLQAILTHEAGHFLGLSHSADTGAIMYAYYQPGATQLTADDYGGICAVYPYGVDPSASSNGICIENANDGVHCSCNAVGKASGAAASAGALCLAVLAWLRRRPGRARRALG